MKNSLAFPIFIALIAACTFTACTKNESSQTITEKRAVNPFDQITINAPGLVEVSESGAFSVQIVGDEQDLPFVEVISNHNLLEISFLKTNFNPNLLIKITTPRAIKSVQNIGKATVSFLGTTKTTQMLVELNGQGAINFQNLETDIFEAKLKGSGSMKLAGKATHEKVISENATHFDALNFMAETSEISLMGSGTTAISVKNTLQATIAGSGTVSYMGDPTIEEHITGTGKLVKL